MNINQKYKTKNTEDNNPARFPLDSYFQGVNRLLVLAFNNTGGINRV